MGIPLYDLSVASYLQTLGGVIGFMERGLAHCRDNGLDPEEIVETRLWNDMLPFRFQIVSVAHHSRGAIEGLKAGEFAPPNEQRPLNYAQLQGLVAETRDALAALSRDEINALEGRDVVFRFRDFKIPYTAENFVMSFSLPNFYFHATTAYDILRSKGVPLGKRDFMGQMRTKAPA
ncbi:MAG TPA: DUF1993 domain-containing protein [Caulobacteraceae bacterium]|nr:DUF1993 domain-containing protein [Caulobacteraceae bacterium]